MAQTRTAVSKLITWEGQHYDFLQSLIFSAQESYFFGPFQFPASFAALQERNFFPSEGCFYHWAAEERQRRYMSDVSPSRATDLSSSASFDGRPDFIVFGFTVCHLAMIIGEALSIPLVGFICQPDHKIEERRDTSTAVDQLLEPTRKAMNSEGFNAALMSVMQQMSVRGQSLNCLRRTRGLITIPAGLTDSMVHFDELHEQGVPMVVPISPVAVGNYLQQLQHYILTDFVFLRSSADLACCQTMQFLTVNFVRPLPAFLIEICARDMLPHSGSQGTKGDVLDDELSSFVKQAKDAGRPARALSDRLTSFLHSRVVFSFRCFLGLLLLHRHPHFMLAVPEPRAVWSCTRISLCSRNAKNETQGKLARHDRCTGEFCLSPSHQCRWERRRSSTWHCRFAASTDMHNLPRASMPALPYRWFPLDFDPVVCISEYLLCVSMSIYEYL
ncbi:ATG26 [Symbiodinium sp. CCMP2592]|nr:ATG26 [Symbiodinium sp. CCMP2592]